MGRQIIAAVLLCSFRLDACVGEELPMASRPLPTRQIHLDFHNSEKLPDIGVAFDKRQFQDQLRRGRVNAVNIFAKGHHSWSYYPTEVGRVHPELDFDLLGAQIEACHEIGVECPIYFTVGWSVNDVADRPEWAFRHKDGGFRGGPPAGVDPNREKPTGGWRLLVPAGEYHELVKKQVIEICDRYDVDGFWFDIYQSGQVCYSDECLARMEREGLDPDDREAAVRNFAEIYREHMRELREIIAARRPDATVFFNGTTDLRRNASVKYGLYEFNTHQDLEDLPTGWGGYDKFPLEALYFQKLGYQVCAMSGKFHTAWGEFGGFKHVNGLKYEAASMVAFGAACNFGDQLHPSGVMDPRTYANVGEAFACVESIEEYGPGGKPVADLGLWFTVHNDTDQTAASLLLETQTVFGIADRENLEEFDAVLVPCRPCLDAADAVAPERFVADGGGLLVLADGGLTPDRAAFAVDVGVDRVGGPRFDVDYTAVTEALGDDLPASPFLVYVPAGRVVPRPRTEVLARLHEPSFSRTFGKFTSHRNTPHRPEPTDHPALTARGRVVYAASPLDDIYARRAAPPHRELFAAALRRVLHLPMLEADLPTAGRVSLLHRPEESRHVAHLLYVTPHYRGGLELIEDLVPLRDVAVTLRVPKAVRSARLIPDDVPLELEPAEGGVRVVVPEFTMHAAVVFEY